MKKLLSVILTAIMAVSVLSLTAVTAMAEPVVNSPMAEPIGAITQVNGVVNTKDVHFATTGTAPLTVSFTYTGEGTLKGWETNLAALGFVKGVDYTLVENKDGSLTVTFMSDSSVKSWDDGEVIVNALVDFDSASTTKKNDSSKSPSTGIATIAISGSAAAACAGFAVLSSTKKKDAE